jgi:putative ABC transport system permease protein
MRIWSVARGPGLILLGAALAYTGLQTLSEFVTRLGVSLAVVSSWTRSESVTRLGVSLAVVGCGLAAHTLLLHSPVRPALRERLVFSLIGLGLLLVWALPWVAWLGITSLNQDAYFFVLAGIMMIGGAIWIVMYNVDGLLWVLNRLFGHFGVLAPVLRTATAYPLSNRLRSGLAMAMFAVVIFLVVTMATVINTQQLMASTSDSETAGFDMRLTSTSSIADLRTAIQSQPGLPVADITTIGRSTSRPIEVRQVGALRQSWSIRYPLIGVDAGFIDQAQAVYQFQLRAPGYDSDQAVWQALRERDDVVVAPAELVPPRGVDASRRSLFYLEGMHTGDQILPPITLEMRQPNATQGAVTSYQVIAVLEQDATAAGSGMLSSEPGLERLTGGPVSPGTYYVKVRQGAAARPVAQALERAFQLYGMTARTYQDITLEREGTVLALMQLLQGFMALGLLVGIAALGVISSRNVVDRRQQVGVLRAIGFQPGMVGLSFVLESSFVSLWGILIGTLLSLVLSANMVSNMAHFRAGLTLSPPWGEIIAIALIAYGFSLITTIVPAYQASRIYPAEALRYE